MDRKSLSEFVASCDMNPYDAPADVTTCSVLPDSPSRARQCPVCRSRVRRIALIWPTFRCRTCSSRLTISGSSLSRLMSSITFLVLSAGLVFFAASASAFETYLIVSILAYVLLSTFWLHLFGQPRLKGWFGYASSHTLHNARRTYLRKFDTDR